MDLYNSLKEGASEEALLAEFQKKLDEAKNRLHQEATREADLTQCRQDLAAAVLKYFKIAFGESLGAQEQARFVTDFLRVLEELEKNADNSNPINIDVNIDVSSQEDDANDRNEKPPMTSSNKEKDKPRKDSSFQSFTWDPDDDILYHWLKSF